jgi:hypothetical protein
MDSAQGQGYESPCPPQHALKGNTPIIDRKIEKKALTNSFSSNLAHQGHQSTPPSRRKVRDMVNLFEKSPVSTTKSESTTDKKSWNRDASDGSICRLENTASKQNANSTLVHSPEETLQATPRKAGKGDKCSRPKFTTSDVEPPPSPSLNKVFTEHFGADENSLEVLQCKSFMNNRPLGRCLDENEISSSARLKESATQSFIAGSANGKLASVCESGYVAYDNNKDAFLGHSEDVPSSPKAELRRLFRVLEKFDPEEATETEHQDQPGSCHPVVPAISDNSRSIEEVAAF